MKPELSTLICIFFVFGTMLIFNSYYAGTISGLCSLLPFLYQYRKQKEKDFGVILYVAINLLLIPLYIYLCELFINIINFNN